MSWGTTAVTEIGENATLVPTEVPGLRDVVAIAANDRDSLVLLKNGKVMAWGGNEAGQLGDGTNNSTMVPVEVQGLREITSIAEGAEFGLALGRNGTVKAWGSGALGDLGDGTTKGSPVPEEVPGLTQVTALAAGRSHALALRSDGTVMTWGWNRFGQLGDGTNSGPDVCGPPGFPESCSKSPVAVPGLNGATSISAGWFGSVTLLRTGTIEAWGVNGGGSMVPVEVKEAHEVIAISAGIVFSVASGAL
jgi:alpha-tubulin suppressor-like RCC1 family protein